MEYEVDGASYTLDQYEIAFGELNGASGSHVIIVSN